MEESEYPEELLRNGINNNMCNEYKEGEDRLRYF